MEEEYYVELFLQILGRILNSITLTLPYPVSANRYWMPVRLGKRVAMVPTREAKAYKDEVRLRALAAGVYAPITGRVSVDILLYPARPQNWEKRQQKFGDSWEDTVRCIDVGNCEKVLGDAFNGIVFEDDKWVWDMRKRRMAPAERALVVVTISELIGFDYRNPAIRW